MGGLSIGSCLGAWESEGENYNMGCSKIYSGTNSYFLSLLLILLILFHSLRKFEESIILGNSFNNFRPNFNKKVMSISINRIEEISRVCDLVNR